MEFFWEAVVDVSTVEVGDFCSYGFLGRQKFWASDFLGSRKIQPTNHPKHPVDGNNQFDKRSQRTGTDRELV